MINKTVISFKYHSMFDNCVKVAQISDNEPIYTELFERFQQQTKYSDFIDYLKLVFSYNF